MRKNTSGTFFFFFEHDKEEQQRKGFMGREVMGARVGHLELHKGSVRMCIARAIVYSQWARTAAVLLAQSSLLLTSRQEAV